MSLTRASLKQPAAVLVLSLMLLLLGALAIHQLPVQLLPSIEQPQIWVQSNWRAAAPEEMESTIMEPLETALRGVPGVLESVSVIRAGTGFVTLTFDVQHDMQQAMLNVSNALSQLPPRPRDASEPVVTLNSGSSGVASLFLRKLDEQADYDFTALQPLIDEVIYPKLLAIPGIAQVVLPSHRAKELHITFDPYRLAALGLTVADLSDRVNRAANVSGGFVAAGRREFTIRFIGQYDLTQYEQMIIAHHQGRPLYLHEVAQVNVRFAEPDFLAIRNGTPAYYLRLDRSVGSNTVAIMAQLNQQVAALNQQDLRQHGVELVLSFDASVHIKRAVKLVQGNLLLGIALALFILYLFLRGWQATLLIGLTIPVSLMVSLLLLNVLGRSLNVVSLAGLAFAVGMVLDAAIVVQENIVRLVQQGMVLKQAIKQGTAEVSSALWTSTATTVAIFLPVLFMQGVAGQLFYDMALTLAVAVSASLLVALTLLPVASLHLLKPASNRPLPDAGWQRLAQLFYRCNSSKARARGWVALSLPGGCALIALLLPKADFLPQASIDTVSSFLTAPAGTNMSMLSGEVGNLLVERLSPYYLHKQYPAIKGYHLWMNRQGNNNLFIYAEDPDSIADMMTLLREEILVGLPDIRTSSVQGSLFNFGFGSGRELNLDFQGPDMAQLMAQAESTMPQIEAILPGASVQPVPALSMAQPELQLTPDEHRITQSGLHRGTVATMVRAVTGGLYIGEYFDGNDRMDIILKGPKWHTPEQLAATPLYTPLAGHQTLGQLSELSYTTGPVSLQRVNGLRTVSLRITPPANMALDAAIRQIQQQLLPPLRPTLAPGMSVQLRGNADRLSEVLQVMSLNFIIALLALFLLMAALFRSATDSLLVMLSIPTSILGGVLALQILNLFSFQSLDLLTMIGFVILLGLVVNNSILLVDRCRKLQQQGLLLEQALFQAIHSRARPIFMSTLTSIFGMLPLVLMPGTGSEIYRGLATVIVGGMTFSMVFSLIVIPALIIVAPVARPRWLAVTSKEKADVC